MPAPLHPLKVMTDWKVLKTDCKLFALEHDDIIVLSVNDFQYTMLFSEKINNYEFEFSISNLDIDNNTKETVALLHIQPISTLSLKTTVLQQPLNQISKFLNSWVGLVREYYKHLPETIQIEEWTDHYFEDFKIHEDDAETAVFDESQQKYLINILGYIESAIQESEDHDEKTAEILNEISNLKENINQPKNIVMKGLARVKAFVHLKGPEFSKKVWEKVQDLVIKYATEKTIQGIMHWGMKLITHH